MPLPELILQYRNDEEENQGGMCQGDFCYGFL